MNLIQRILCPVDFSETSSAAFHYADRLAHGTGAELVLLHAFEVPESLDPRSQERPADPRLKEQLEKFRPSSAGVKVTYVLHAGLPGEVICWLAQERKCDLIVMGTHGRTGLKHLLFGSVAEYVLKHARSPVLTIRLRPANESPLREPMVLPVPLPRLL